MQSNVARVSGKESLVFRHGGERQMGKTRNIIAVIPARGGSKGIPRKNIKLLNGKPMIYYTINEAHKSKYIQRLFVSTEDEEIAIIAMRYGAEVVPRPMDLAQDDTPSHPVFQQAIKYLEKTGIIYPDIVVVLQPTSPLRKVEDIDGAIEKFMEVGCESVVSVCEVEYPIEGIYRLGGDRLQPLTKAGKGITRRQDASIFYRLNGAVEVTKRDVIMEQDSIMGDGMRAYIMPFERSVDIDTDLDFKLAEVLMGENEL